MNHAKENNVLKRFFNHIYISYIPNSRDNLKQIILKILFIVCLVTLIISAVYLADYFWEAEHQENIVDYSRDMWHETVSTNENENVPEVDEHAVDAAKIQYMLEENSDFKGWITIAGTQVDNPIYQAADNDYYLNRNQLKQKSVYGSLYFDYRNRITETERDKNLIIYGHEMKNGSMFGTLKKLKRLDFYKQYPTLEFSTLYEKHTYKIYSIFILNATREDDDGYIYNVYRQNFNTEEDFNYWADEAFERSIINTGVDVEYDDNILTLITCSNDFPNARLVVMARQLREGESNAIDTEECTVNANPRYPKKWYDHRGIKYPFEKKKDSAQTEN